VDASFCLCWLSAVVVLALVGFLRHPSTALWWDLIGAASIALLLSVAFQIPFIGRYADLSVGGVSALASLAAQKLFNYGVLASILSGLIVGFVFGLGLAVLGIRAPRKSWWITGFVGLVALVATATWEFWGTQPLVHPDLALPGDLTGPLSVLIPAIIGLIGLHLLIYQSAFGLRLRSPRPLVGEPEGERTVRGAFLLSGVIAGFAGSCAGALLCNAGLGHASMFALSPLALILLSGAALNRRLPRLENLAPAALIYAGIIYLVGTPGWSNLTGEGPGAWERSSPLLPTIDGLMGLGVGVVLTALLVFRDQILGRVPVDTRRSAATADDGVKEETAGKRGPISVEVSPHLAIALAALLVGGAGLGVYSAFHHSLPSDAALVKRVSGTVERMAANTDRWRRVNGGDVLFGGDAVRTGEKSAVFLRMPGKGALRVDASTVVRVRSLGDPSVSEQKTNVALFRGKVWADVREKLLKTSDSTFEIHTPIAIAAVRGTQFAAAFIGDPGREEATFSVNEGTVAVQDGRRSISLHAGQVCKTTKRKGTELPVEMSADAVKQWQERGEELREIWSVNVSRSTRTILVGVLALMIVVGFLAEMFYGETRPDL